MATVVDSNMLRRDMQPHGAAVRRQLADARAQIRRHLFCEGLAWTVGVAAVLIVISFAADRGLRLSTSTRMAWLPVGIVAILATVYGKLLRPLWLPLPDLDLALVLDRRMPGFAERVANVLQLPRLLEADVAASPSMIEAAVRQQAAELRAIDVRAPFDRERFVRLAFLIIVPAVVLVGLALAQPAIARLWAQRWFAGSNERWPQHTYLSIVGLADGDRLFVARGESILLEVDAAPEFTRRSRGWKLDGRGERLVLRTAEEPESETPDEVRIRYRQAGTQKIGLLTHYAGARFRYELTAIEETIEFRLSGGDDWLGPLRIEPLDRPGIADLKIVSRSPGHAEPETRTFASQDAQLLFLPRTKLELSLTSDLPLASAELIASSGETAPRFMRHDSTHYRAQWEMSESQTFEIKLVDARAHLESKPYFISLGLLQDRIPRVTVRSSGVGRRVTPQATVPMELRAIDDFGLASVAIEVEQSIPGEQKPETRSSQIAVPLPASDQDRAQTETATEQSVALKEFAVAPGHTARLRGTATDNRAEGGQQGQSRWLTFQVVTPEELFYEILMAQRAQREKFRAALEAEKSQAAALEAAPDGEELAGIARKHQVIARQVWQIATRLEASLREMTLNDLGSPQARELLSTGIIAQLRELHESPMARLRRLLEQVASEPARLSELGPAAIEAQQETIEKMSKILERMAQWESFVDVLNQVRHVIQLQNQVLDSTQETKTDRTKDLFDDE